MGISLISIFPNFFYSAFCETNIIIFSETFIDVKRKKTKTPVEIPGFIIVLRLNCT